MKKKPLRDRILETELLPDQVALFYIGQVGFIIKYRDTYTMIDGYLSDYVDKHFKTDLVPWERLYPAPMAPEELDFIDYVFCTHTHCDHQDPWTISGMAEVNKHALFIGPASVCKLYPEFGVPEDRILELKIDQVTTLDEGKEIAVKAIPSAHEELHPDGQGGFEEVGYRIRFGNKSIYHSGDCCPYEGLEERIGRCSAVILPVNGRDYYRTHVKDIIGCFDSVEAVTLAKNTLAGMLIPVHWDLYAVNEINPGHFADVAHKIAPRLPYHFFVPEEKYILD